jgi:hypothetical protein
MLRAMSSFTSLTQHHRNGYVCIAIVSSFKQKKGVEGTLFVFRRTQAPTFGFQILNRLDLNDLKIYLSSDLELETSGDFLIFKTESGKLFIEES